MNYLCSKQLLQAACVDEFNTRYLTNPDSASFRRTLSGLMNYALYEQEQSREHFDPYELETEAFQQDLTDYCQEEAELDEQIARLMLVLFEIIHTQH